MAKKSLASLERYICEKELLIDVEELRELSRFSAGLAVPGLSPTDGGNLFNCNQPFIISSSHRLV